MSQFAGKFVTVRDEAELSKLMKICSRKGTPVLPTSNLDMPPILEGEEEHCVVSLGSMNEVIAYAADDLTITVGAGAKVADVQNRVAEYGQRLTVEVPYPKDQSIGALVGMGSAGFLGQAYGGVSDQVLGIRAIAGDGRKLVGGGRVVKNVTGYDFVRLLSGSAGSLGIITELTFRLRPNAPGERTFILEPGNFQRLVRVAKIIRSYPHLLTAIVGLDGTILSTPKNGPLLIVRGEGSEKSLRSLEQQLDGLACLSTKLEPNDAEFLWHKIRQFPSKEPFHLALRLPPSQVGKAHEQLTGPAVPCDWGFIADMNRAHVSFTSKRSMYQENHLAKLDVPSLETTLHAQASLPDELIDRESRWDYFNHPPQAARKIGDRIKIAFDPAGILMPKRPIAGRF